MGHCTSGGFHVVPPPGDNIHFIYIFASPPSLTSPSINISSLIHFSTPKQRERERERERIEGSHLYIIMRPGSSSLSAGLQSWRSPLPYLFGGLAAMVGLIAVALIVLACTRHKSAEGGESSTAAPPCAMEKPMLLPLDREPRIVVIMAGDDFPTFFAKPLSPLPV
ncbi:hypothetical protein Cni_G03925 [Canna indica]|uniref:Uncharacterized protein n=1 Tax=Canna indica TaxID=4628 RepID=A0AAQ3JTI3_9LILI|nr:hypothetical protein Cni_G03925 [Canna indica]